jgi:uncharacterized protein with NRDE domain
MCTLAIYVGQFSDLPLVVAANRDEFFTRPATPPVLLDRHPRIVGGRDLRGGGTWLGISDRGVVAGLLNRRMAEPPLSDKRSRGLLPLAMLAAESSTAARRALDTLEADQYNAFNLLVADRESAWVAQNRDGTMHVTVLETGVHVLTNLDVNDPTCPRIARTHRLFVETARSFETSGDRRRFREALRGLLSSHTTVLDPRLPDELEALCVHAGGFGTRSSSLLFLGADGRWEHWFADGPPCRTEHRPALAP